MKITCPKCKRKYEISPEDKDDSTFGHIPLECECGELFSLVNFDLNVSTLDYDDDQEKIMQFNSSNILKKGISELQGIAAAIVYDKQVDDGEMKLIASWLSEHKDLLDQWPVNDLAVLMYDIIKDGIITNDERKRLYDFLITFAVAPKLPKHITGIFETNPALEFKECIFCFTGKLAMGQRRSAENAVLARGGLVNKGIIANLDYLVVGEMGSNAWANGRFGRKIEQAIDYQKAQHHLLIIKESDFIKNLT